MPGTTHSAIRVTQLEVLRQLVMTALPGLRLRTRDGDNHPDFAAWANAGQGQPARTVEIAHGFDLVEEKYLDEETAEELHTEVVMVCYPVARELEGMLAEDLIEQDLEDIDRVLGERGYGFYAELAHGLHRCALERAVLRELPAARLLEMTFSLHYDRSVP